jgi:hypothetical protein
MSACGYFWAGENGAIFTIAKRRNNITRPLIEQDN